MSNITPEFWASLVGAVVGALLAGGFTAAITYWQLWRAKRDRERGMAQSILFKLCTIQGNLESFRDHIEQSRALSHARGVPEGWWSLRAFGNLPPRIYFTSEDMGFLWDLKRNALANSILSLDAAHSSMIDMWTKYAQLRDTASSMLPSVALSGTIGETDVDEDLAGFLAPLSAQMQELIEDMRVRSTARSAEARLAARDFAEAVTTLVGYYVEIGSEKGARKRETPNASADQAAQHNHDDQ